MSVTRRESLGDQLLATFTATSDQLHQVCAQCRLAGLGAPLLSSRGSAPCADDRRSAAHGVSHARVDIRSKLEPEAHLAPESFSTFVEMFTGAFGWCRWALVPGGNAPAPVRYRFEVTGPVSLRRDLVVEGHQAHLEPVAAAHGSRDLRLCDGALCSLALRTPAPARRHCSGPHYGRGRNGAHPHICAVVSGHVRIGTRGAGQGRAWTGWRDTILLSYEPYRGGNHGGPASYHYQRTRHRPEGSYRHSIQAEPARSTHRSQR